MQIFVPRLTGLINYFRHGALDCLKQLHRAGFHHGDVSPRNFGARNGEMVILDFSQTGPCEICDPSSSISSSADDACYEITRLKETLFGNGEEA